MLTQNNKLEVGQEIGTGKEDIVSGTDCETGIGKNEGKLELMEKRDFTEAITDQDQPFVLRFKIGYFGPAVGIGAQAALWKELAVNQSMMEYGIPLEVSQFFWYITLLILLCSLGIYISKLVLYPFGVLREFVSPVRANFFFMPTLTCTFLLISAPPEITNETTILALFYIVLVIETFLRIFLWGEWLGSKTLSLGRIYVPAMLSVVNCFVLASLAVTPVVGQPQLATCLVSIGLVFYTIVLVRTFGRPLSDYIPLTLMPSLFFYLAPVFSVSGVWPNLPIVEASINDYTYGAAFDNSMAAMFFYFGLFMYLLLLRYMRSFIHLNFALTWWAYTFPTAAAGIASIQWAAGYPQGRAKFALFLSCVSTSMVMLCLILMLYKTIPTKSTLGTCPNDTLVAFCLDKALMDTFHNRKVKPIARNDPKHKCEEYLSLADQIAQNCPWAIIDRQPDGNRNYRIPSV